MLRERGSSSKLPGPSRGVQWRSLSSVGASIGDPFEGAGTISLETTKGVSGG